MYTDLTYICIYQVCLMGASVNVCTYMYVYRSHICICMYICMYISGMPDGGERLVELSVLKKQVQHFLRVLLHLHIYLASSIHLYSSCI
jgi:hypothetical protein